MWTIILTLTILTRCVVAVQRCALVRTPQVIELQCVIEGEGWVWIPEPLCWCVLWHSSSRISEPIFFHLHTLRVEGELTEFIIVEGKQVAASELVSVSTHHLIGLLTGAGNDQLVRFMPPFVEIDHEVDSWLHARDW